MKCRENLIVWVMFVISAGDTSGAVSYPALMQSSEVRSIGWAPPTWSSSELAALYDALELTEDQRTLVAAFEAEYHDQCADLASLRERTQEWMSMLSPDLVRIRDHEGAVGSFLARSNRLEHFVINEVLAAERLLLAQVESVGPDSGIISNQQSVRWVDWMLGKAAAPWLRYPPTSFCRRSLSDVASQFAEDRGLPPLPAPMWHAFVSETAQFAEQIYMRICESMFPFELTPAGRVRGEVEGAKLCRSLLQRQLVFVTECNEFWALSGEDDFLSQLLSHTSNESEFFRLLDRVHDLETLTPSQEDRLGTVKTRFFAERAVHAKALVAELEGALSDEAIFSFVRGQSGSASDRCMELRDEWLEVFTSRIDEVLTDDQRRAIQ